jgi:prepilin-type N-terminal cleavage/methylation domain-containing protein
MPVRHGRPQRSATARGFVLLEVLVALVVLSLVGLGYLQLFHQGYRLAAGSREWLQAVEYAEDGIEQAKLGTIRLDGLAAHPLGDGFRRQITRQPWQDGFELVTVTVFRPDGARFELHRLARIISPAAGTRSAPEEQW